MAEIAIGIDSRGAEQGASRVNSALDSIARQAQNAAGAILGFERNSNNLASALGKVSTSGFVSWTLDVAKSLVGLLNPLSAIPSAVNLVLLAFEGFANVVSVVASLLNPITLLQSAFSLVSGAVGLFTGAISGMFGAISGGLQFFANLNLSMQGFIAFVTPAIDAVKSLGSAFFNAVSTAANFDVQMKNIQAVSLASAEDMLKLRDAALQVGQDTPLAASQAAEALLGLKRAGLDTEAAISALAPAVNASLASGADLANVQQILVSTTNAMSLGFENSAQTLDILLMATQKSALSMESLGDGLSYVAPTASALNQTLPATAAAMGKLADAGFDGSRAGTGLNQILLKLQNPTSQITELFNKFGVSLDSVNPITNNFVDILAKMEAAGMKSSDVIGAFGVRAGPQLGALLTQGSDSVKTLQTALESAAGTGAAMFAVQMDNLQKSMISLDGSIEALQISVGDIAQKGFKMLVDEAILVVNAIRNFWQETGLAAAATDIFTAVSRELLEIFRLFAPQAESIADPLRQLAEIYKANSAAVLKWIDGISEAVASSKNITEGVKNIGVALNGIITEVINWGIQQGGVNAILETSIAVFGSFSSVLSVVFGWFEKITPAALRLTDSFLLIATGAAEAFAEATKSLSDFIAQFVKISEDGRVKIDFVGMFRASLHEAAKFITGTGKTIITEAFITLREAIANGVSLWSVSFAEGIRGGGWGAAINELQESILVPLEEMFNIGLDFIYDRVAQWSPAFADSLRNGNWGEAFDYLKGIFSDGVNAAYQIILDATDTFFSEYRTKIDSFFGSIVTSAQGHLSTLNSVIKSQVGMSVQDLGALGRSFGELASGITTVGSTVAAPINFVGETIGKMAAYGVDGVEKLGRNIKSFATQFGSSFGEVKVVGDTVGTGLRSALMGVVDSMPKPENYRGWGVPVGAAIGGGIADGIQNSMGRITNALGAINDVAAGQSPPPKGPLSNIDTGAMRIGEAWSAGLAKGISAGPITQQITPQGKPAAQTQQSGGVNISGININVSGGGTPAEQRQTGQNVANALLNELRKSGVRMQ